MAATNYTPIQLYYSTTASAAPSAGNLTSGELAINITDGKLYYKDNAGNVQVIATKGAGTIGGSNTQIQYNNNGALAGNAAMTFNSGTNTVTLTTLNLTNALGATYGGTAQSSYTQGDILYSSASNTLSKLGIGTVNYILTSTGSVPQWSAPSSITVQTATNLAGGAAGSVPYQSAPDTTTFLSIGAANRVMTSSGSAPQWVTALTGLTGVSSSSITNTSLTATRLVYSSTAGLQTDSANLTFDGTTLSATGYSTTGLSTLVKTVTIGNSNFSGTAVFAAATPAKLYVGTGTVTDTTSAIGATNATGAISSLAITPIAATNTSVTYTNASTLYIAGAPSAGTNVTITNPYSLYVAAGAAYFGGAVTYGAGLTLGGNLLFNPDNTYDIGASGANRARTLYLGTSLITPSATISGLTSGRVPYASTGGLLTDSANLLYSGTDLTVYGITVGRGAGAGSTNTVVGASALSVNTAGANIVAVGYQALKNNTANNNTAVGYNAAVTTTSQLYLAAFGYQALVNSSGDRNTGIGFGAGQAITTGGYNTAIGSQAMGGSVNNITGTDNIAVGAWHDGVIEGPLSRLSSGNYNVAIGNASLRLLTTGNYNVALGQLALTSNISANSNTAIGDSALANTTAATNTALGGNAGYTNSTGSNNVFIGHSAGFEATIANQTVMLGFRAGRNFTTPDGTIAIGYEAGYNGGAVTHTGAYNILIGGTISGVQNPPGFSLSSGANNVFIGNGSGQAASSGSQNTFVGHRSGDVMQTGGNNTIIGRFSGNQYNFDLRTASNRVVLSDGSGQPLSVIDGSNGATTEYNQVGGYATSVSRMITSWGSASAVNLLTVSDLGTNNWTLIKVRILLVHAVGNDSAEIEFVASYGRTSSATPTWTLGTPVITYALGGYSAAGTVTTSGGTLIYTPGFGGQYYRAIFFIDTLSMDGATVVYNL